MVKLSVEKKDLCYAFVVALFHDAGMSIRFGTVGISIESTKQ